MILDLNADVGEGAGTDAELMNYITSANVCCGMHAGDAEASFKTLQLAKSHGVVCGAHPGFADRKNFGRKEHLLEEHGAFALCRHQIDTLYAIAATIKVQLRFVKPHGALYHMASCDAEVARGVFRSAVYIGMCLVGLPDSELERVTKGLEKYRLYIREGFADRRYHPDGTLVPRSEPNALLHDPKEVVDQVEWLVKEKNVRTICVHGDTPGAVEFVRKVREYLLAKGHQIQPFA